MLPRETKIAQAEACRRSSCYNSMATLFHQITICGVGLIGGSLALIAREQNLIERAVGLGRTLTNLEVARKRGMIDLATQDPIEAARDADLLMLAVPIRTID